MATNEQRGESKTSLMGYFRRLFAKRPELIHVRNNDEVLRQWLADHPDQKEVPARVRNILANLKYTLRKNSAKSASPDPSADGQHLGDKPIAVDKRLELLEERIDEALSLARLAEDGSLREVIKLLHRARNQVVLKLHQ